MRSVAEFLKQKFRPQGQTSTEYESTKKRCSVLFDNFSTVPMYVHIVSNSTTFLTNITVLYTDPPPIAHMRHKLLLLYYTLLRPILD